MKRRPITFASERWDTREWLSAVCVNWPGGDGEGGNGALPGGYGGKGGGGKGGGAGQAETEPYPPKTPSRVVAQRQTLLIAQTPTLGPWD